MTTSLEQAQIDLVKENEELKAQVNLLLKACKLYGDGIDEAYALDEADTIVLMTPEQCLNSVKEKAVCDFANKYCKDCTTEYQTQLSEDAWNHCEDIRKL